MADNNCNKKCEDNPATEEQYKEYLATDAAKAPLHGFFAVYRMRTPDGVHTTKKKPCNKYGHTKEPDPKTGADVGGVKLFTATAAELMDVLNQPQRRRAIIANIRRSITYGAEKDHDQAWENEYHAINGALQTEVMNMPAEVQSAAWDEAAEAEKASAEAGAELEYLRTVEISLLLGRRFDAAADGIIALDCDGHHPSEDFDTEALYREVSSSGTGDHILYRIADGLIPDTSENKTKATIDGREYELFYGPGNGLAISGMEAIANPAGPTLNMESPAGRIIDQLIHSGADNNNRQAPLPPRTAGEEPQPEPEPLTSWQQHMIRIWEHYERGIVANMRTFTYTKEQYTISKASEAFQSITSKIAMHAAIEAHKAGIEYDHIATTARIKKLWETHRIYREAYAAGGNHEYNESKIRLTIGKAINDGRKLYNELMTHPRPTNGRGRGRR